MSTQIQKTSETPTPTPAPKAKRPRRTFSVNLRSADGASLRITMKLQKDGTATTHAVHKPGKGGKSVRGASERHESADAGKAAVERLVKQAQAKGWERKERSGGFQAKPDAFSAANLPAAKTSKK